MVKKISFDTDQFKATVTLEHPGGTHDQIMAWLAKAFALGRVTSHSMAVVEGMTSVEEKEIE